MAEHAGWISYARPEGGGTHMHVTCADGRWVIDQLYVHGAEITATVLQDVPVSYLALVMNLIPVDMETLRLVVKFGGLGYPVLPDAAREPALAALRNQITAETPAEFRIIEPFAADRPKLARPDGSDPAGFYAQVAAAYREYAPNSRAPAVKIAEEAGVPVPTARSWIREARRRGALPPGKQGKAG